MPYPTNYKFTKFSELRDIVQELCKKGYTVNGGGFLEYSPVNGNVYLLTKDGKPEYRAWFDKNGLVRVDAQL